jgi:hypothetical protein
LHHFGSHPYSEAEALFCAGAGLAALDPVAKSDPPWAGVWRRRLALKCAAAAQNLLCAFRTLADRDDPLRPERLAAVAADLMAPLDPDRAGELAGALKRRSRTRD